MISIPDVAYEADKYVKIGLSISVNLHNWVEQAILRHYVIPPLLTWSWRHFLEVHVVETVHGLALDVCGDLGVGVAVGKLVSILDKSQHSLAVEN